MLFSLLIAVLWAWSPFTHPPTRCTRCTSAAPHLRPWHTRTSGTCPQNAVEPRRVSGWRLRPCARSAGTSGPPALRRRSAPNAGTSRGADPHPRPANPRRPASCPGQRCTEEDSALLGGQPRIPAQPARRLPASVLTTGRGHHTQVAAPNGGYSRTGRGPVPVAERDPITGALTRALWSHYLVVI